MNKSISIVLIAGVLMVGFIVAIVVRDLKHRAWMEWAPGQINRIAYAVEVFRDEEGSLPKDLQDLEGRSYDKEFLARILTSREGIQYRYRAVNNGYLISVTMPGGLLFKNESMEKFFEPGVTLNNEHPTVTKTRVWKTNNLPKQ